jgi:hypothetical protein
MSIKCICADLEKLRDGPGKPGPLSKIANFEDLSSVLDHVRRMRFIKAFQPEVIEYAKAIATLGKKYGKPMQNGSYFVIEPEKEDEYRAEKDKFDAEEREIVATPLPFSAYEKIALSALDLLALEPFIVIPDEQEQIAIAHKD